VSGRKSLGPGEKNYARLIRKRGIINGGREKIVMKNLQIERITLSRSGPAKNQSPTRTSALRGRSPLDPPTPSL
jgi:hypothetical protein